MPNPSDSQNNTQELVQKILFPLAYDGITAGEVQKAHARFVALIAQREQAAELRGRESETEYWRQSGFLPLFDADKRLTELEIQATKPEKGDRNDTD